MKTTKEEHDKFMKQIEKEMKECQKKCDKLFEEMIRLARRIR